MGFCYACVGVSFLSGSSSRVWIWVCFFVFFFVLAKWLVRLISQFSCSKLSPDMFVWYDSIAPTYWIKGVCVTEHLLGKKVAVKTQTVKPEWRMGTNWMWREFNIANNGVSQPGTASSLVPWGCPRSHIMPSDIRDGLALLAVTSLTLLILWLSHMQGFSHCVSYGFYSFRFQRYREAITSAMNLSSAGSLQNFSHRIFVSPLHPELDRLISVKSANGCPVQECVHVYIWAPAPVKAFREIALGWQEE